MFLKLDERLAPRKPIILTIGDFLRNIGLKFGSGFNIFHAKPFASPKNNNCSKKTLPQESYGLKVHTSG